jgi:hypothetical protein
LVWEKYYNNGKLPNHTLKGSFWWRDILRLLGKFKEIASVNINLGDTCFLWHDLWGNSVQSQVYGQLFSFAKSVNISVFRAKSTTDIRTLFHLPISQESYAQLMSLALAQEIVELSDSDQQDVWTYSWGSPFFSSTKAYKKLIGTRQLDVCFHWLWKCSAQKKHKVFFWLLLKDRLSTRNILRRKTEPCLHMIVFSVLNMKKKLWSIYSLLALLP